MTRDDSIRMALEALELMVVDVKTTPTAYEAQRQAIAALRAALAQKPEPVCKCDLRTRLVGDGCEVCNPELAAEFAQQAEPVQEPLVWKPTWRLHALTQREYDSLEESVRWHYKRIAPPKAEPAQQPEPVQEPVAKVELMTTGGNAGLATRIVEIDDHLRERLRPGQLLYTAPPQRPLAQQPEPAQEPIGWLNGDDEYADFLHRELARIHQQRGSSTPKFFTIPVYTKPFRSKPLTDEEMLDIIDDAFEGSSLLEVARAIERKVRGEA